MDELSFLGSIPFTMEETFSPAESMNGDDGIQPTPISVRGTVLVVDRIQNLPQDLTRHCDDYLAALSPVDARSGRERLQQNPLVFEPVPVPWNGNMQQQNFTNNNVGAMKLKPTNGWNKGQSNLQKESFQSFKNIFDGGSF